MPPYFRSIDRLLKSKNGERDRPPPPFEDLRVETLEDAIRKATDIADRHFADLDVMNLIVEIIEGKRIVHKVTRAR